MERRLGTLEIIWRVPARKCATCASRPTVVSVRPDEPCPELPITCPECGRATCPAICLVPQPGAALTLDEV